MVFDGRNVNSQLYTTPGQLSKGASNSWANVGFPSMGIDGLSSTIKGIRASCLTGTHWALGITTGSVRDSYNTWTHLTESYTAGSFGFHPTSGGNIYSAGITCTPGPCNSITWDGTTSFEIRIKPSGYVVRDRPLPLLPAACHLACCRSVPPTDTDD